MLKNVAGQTVSAQLINTSTGAAVTTGTTNVFFKGDSVGVVGTQTGPFTSTHVGNGVWDYYPTQAQTNFDHVAFTFVNSLAVNVTVQVYTTYNNANAVLALIGAGSITYAGPVIATNGQFSIVQGDDYRVADGRAVSFVVTNGPDLTGLAASCLLKIRRLKGFIASIQTTILNPGTSVQTLQFDLQSSDTATLDEGAFRYDIQATLADGHVVTFNNPDTDRCQVIKQVA